MPTFADQRPDAGDGRRVLLLEPDEQRRDQMTDACEHAGFIVTGVARVAEIERWPIGEIVVTDTEHFSALWRHVGAAHVLVLTNMPSEGIDACARGATAWIPRLCSPEALVAVLVTLADAEPI